MGEPLHDQRAEIADWRALVIVDAEVPTTATGNALTASWRGLLEDGAAYCQHLAGPSLPASWAGIRCARHDSGDTKVSRSR